MRTLVLMRGAPGAGKSSFIREHGLEPYTLSADQIRLQYCSPVLDNNGCITTSQKNDKIVWENLFKMLEYRMQLGCFTVIDATNSKTAEMKRYKDICSKYRYRILLVDMTDIPLEVCKERNKNREEYKRVPEQALENIYSRFATQGVPSGIKVIKPQDFDNEILFKPIDLSEYDNVYVIGDTHGCYFTFLDFNNDVLNHEGENNFFIFLGDYADRGTQNAEMLKLLYEIRNKDNVLLLEGNHDSYWNKWGNDDIESIRSKEFLRYTKTELENKDIFTKKMARELYRKLGQCAYFIYNGYKYFCCHGGLSSMPNNLMFVPAAQMINGVGRYSDYKEISESFAEQYARNFNQSNGIIMINGHRNVQKYDIKVNDYCYNLEGAVEFNGNLRVVRIGKNNTITPYEYKNDLPIAEHLIETKTQFTSSEDNVIINDNTDIKDIVTALRNNKHVIEKKFGNVSSFNFSREAFEKGIWDHMTVKARGLYIDTIKNKILARGYEKFFRLFEVEQTKPDNLARTLKFPLIVYKKENGYLGLIAYNEYTDDLFFTTKSNPDGDYARHFKELFNKLVSTDKKEELKNILKEKNVTLAVEIVDPIFDPHIIKYNKANIYCLDLIKNTIDFEVEGYYELNRVSDLIGLPCKERIAIIEDWDEFEKFYTNAPADPNYYSGSTVRTEGWVIEDADEYMFKIKSDFYNTWKKLRGVANSVIKSGNYKYTGSLQTPMENYFYAWLKENWQTYHYNDTLPKDIISLREEFYKSEYLNLALKVSK